MVGTPLAILDEPAALHTVGGTALWDSIRTAHGEAVQSVESDLDWHSCAGRTGLAGGRHLVENGTARLARGSGLLQGRADRWSHWREILRVNPLARHYPGYRQSATRGTGQRRLRIRGSPERLQKFQIESAGRTTNRRCCWTVVRLGERACARPMFPSVRRAGRWSGSISAPGRAWSAAVDGNLGFNGRVEALAVRARHFRALKRRRRRDRVAWGTYRKLATERRALRVA